MAIVAGHNAQVSFSSAQSGLLLVTNTTRWRLSELAQSTEVTPFKSAFRAFWPNHYASSLEIWGWIDQAASPGFLSNPIYANRITVTIKPDRSEAGKNIVLASSWVERFDWIASLDAPNSFYAIVRGGGSATLSWS